MPILGNQLDIERCPHCGVNSPNVSRHYPMELTGRASTKRRHWGIYSCQRCGGVIIAEAEAPEGETKAIYPSVQEIDNSIPQRSRSFLSQARDTLHAPSGSIMLSAAAIDAMLKEKNYKEGNLHDRIKKAATDGLITPDMATWAHEVRLDANDQRHADEAATEPSEIDARRSLDFALALAQFLFVLPARVKRGLKEAGGKPSA